MNLMAEMQKINEAYCVRNALPVDRRFSDTDLTHASAGIAAAEQALYGGINARRLIPFRVSVTMPERTEQVSIVAASSCDAAVQAIQLLFSDSDECASTGFKVRVEAIRRTEQQPCAAA